MALAVRPHSSRSCSLLLLVGCIVLCLSSSLALLVGLRYLVLLENGLVSIQERLDNLHHLLLVFALLELIVLQVLLQLCSIILMEFKVGHTLLNLAHIWSLSLWLLLLLLLLLLFFVLLLLLAFFLLRNLNIFLLSRALSLLALLHWSCNSLLHLIVHRLVVILHFTANLFGQLNGLLHENCILLKVELLASLKLLHSVLHLLTEGLSKD
mmetsp:Transcript_7810/g.29237  ORF Transcript_7810/g.29237 Transcript_7810/m.29237 type:complete len:210 (+) Transcript_7810:101-730(+)